MSQVNFFNYEKKISPLSGLQRLISKSPLEDMIPAGKSVALKLHMGELGNIRYLRPVFVRTVADIVRSKKGKPFLFDTVAAYQGERRTKRSYLRTAAKNGFARSSMNAPIIIAEDEDEHQNIPIGKRVEGCKLEEAVVPSNLLQADLLIVLSHFKGHELTGMGGAIKNMGMGCVSFQTKRAQHYVNRPEFNAESDCDGCGKCAQACPMDAIELIDGKPERDEFKCSSCGACYFTCPSRCWELPPGAKEKLQIYLSHSASAIVSSFKNRIAFINFIQDVVPICDCAPLSSKLVVQDVGIALSLDPVAIDKASLDLVDQSPVFPGATSVKPPDLLGKIHHTSSLVQLETAEKLGMGSSKYDLVSM